MKPEHLERISNLHKKYDLDLIAIVEVLKDALKRIDELTKLIKPQPTKKAEQLDGNTVKTPKKAHGKRKP